jgi:hypothetical protein
MLYCGLAVACSHAAVASVPPCPSMAKAREEFEIVMFTIIEDLLRKTGEQRGVAAVWD